MPQLKQLSCCIQWADTGAPFQEHGTVYGDGVVESFIIVPNKPQGFSIRLTSRGFICEGLVMIVFIDGNYQCNRTRVNLLPPANDRLVNRTEIDFLLRQKEKSQGDGIYLGREWRFDNHNIVTETPDGFQESHFDDLGVIEVLVLRCRARNREDADYEGSSSGEDSDVFGDRPLIEDQQEPSATSRQAITVSTPVAQASAAPEPAAEEDGGLGLMGIFDGANDPPGIPHHDGGHDAPPGRWIWHQSRPPFPGVPEPPQYHQPEGYRFRSQSYARPPATPHPQPYYDRRSHSGQPERKVHFDDWHAAQQHQQDLHRSFSEIHQPQPQRPVSRVRERWPSNGSQGYPTQSYESQRIDPLSQRTQWHDAPETQDQRPSSRLPHRNEMQPIWGYGNGNAHNSNGNDRAASYLDRSNNLPPSQSSQDQRNANGQQPEERQSSTPRQNSSASVNNTNLGPHPTGAANHTPPTQTARYNTPASPPKDPSVQIHRPSQPGPAFSAAGPEYLQHAEPSNPTPHRSMSSSQAPAPPHHPYPHKYSHPQMTYGYHYPQAPHPGYWPMPPPYPYDPSHTHMQPGQAMVTIYPPYMPPPGHEELISPTNVHENLSGHLESNGDPNPGGYGEPQGGQQDTDNGAGVNQSCDNNAPNDSNGSDRTNGNSNAECKTGSQGANNDEAAGNAYNQENAAPRDQNDNPSWDNNDANGNAGNDDSGNNDDRWGSNNSGGNNDDNWGNGNNGNDGWGGPGSNASPANNTDGWDTPAANNNGPGKMKTSHSSGAEVGIVSDISRDLYGPHGPYYALRAMRLGEPRPDAEEEPRFDVPKSLAMARGSTKQVQPGPGYRYYKKRIVPEYIDTLENPYARFVFKYRTKDQVLNEIGIEIDTEPTGDAEIQDLQNLNKQALIEMLMRAKSALGGKVPSPPPTPSGSAQGSEVNAPIAIDAPKYAYLKYSLPPLRPNLANSRKSSPSEAKSGTKQEQASSGKENNSGWDTQNNNNGGGGWNDTPNDNTTAQGDWGGNGGGSGWDGTPKASTPPGKSPTPPAKRSIQSIKRSSKSADSQRPSLPARPATPPGAWPQNDTAADNWDQAGPQTSGVDW